MNLVKCFFIFIFYFTYPLLSSPVPHHSNQQLLYTHTHCNWINYSPILYTRYIHWLSSFCLSLTAIPPGKGSGGWGGGKLLPIHLANQIATDATRNSPPLLRNLQIPLRTQVCSPHASSLLFPPPFHSLSPFCLGRAPQQLIAAVKL